MIKQSLVVKNFNRDKIKDTDLITVNDVEESVYSLHDKKFKSIYLNIKDLNQREKYICIPNLLMLADCFTFLYSDEKIIINNNMLTLLMEEEGIYVYTFVLKEKIIPTIITSLFSIRNKEDSEKDNSLKQIDRYIELGKFLINLHTPMIIFTDDECHNKIKTITKDKKEKVQIIIKKQKDFIFRKKYQKKLSKCFDEYKIETDNPKKYSLLYCYLVHEKFNFIKEALENNPDIKRFAWIDIGITHVAKNPMSIHRWLYNIPEKLKYMTINLLTEDESNYKNHFTKLTHNGAGGIITGTQRYFDYFYHEYFKVFDTALQDGWYQYEEAFQGIVQKKYPQLFDFYFGKFVNIIENYDIICNDYGLEHELKKTYKIGILYPYFINYYVYHPVFRFEIIKSLLPISIRDEKLPEYLRGAITMALKQRDLNVYKLMINHRPEMKKLGFINV